MTLGSLGVNRPLYEIKAELFKALGHPGNLDMADAVDIGFQCARQIAGNNLRVVNVVLQFHIATVHCL